MSMLDKNRLKEIANEYGTPSYVFDVAGLKERVSSIREIVPDGVKLCYSIKANPFLIPTMGEVTDRLEVCSPGELSICKSLGAKPETIVYSGVCKTKENIRDAVEFGCGVYTAESLLHIKYLNEVAVELGKRLPVLPRLNAGSQFGMSKEDLFELFSKALEYSNLEIVGIHYFAGTQRTKLSHQVKELTMLRNLYEEVEKEFGIRLKRLEYGPGLPFPYFEGDNFEDTLSPMKELAPVLEEVKRWCDLTIEMGRFFASECGYYLTRVMDIKSNKDTNYCILDGGMNHVNYLGQIMGMKVPVIHHIKGEEKENAASETGLGISGRLPQGSNDYALCGSLCTTADVLVRKVSFDNLEIDDILAFCNIGAYSVTEGIYLFLSRTMPRILLAMPDGQIQIARDFFESSTINTIR
ncbi:diaminopimelate decarboxylase [Butyrivibrio sp. INlla14]|nr:diaminopimelate decarboxylase [Butyrivibrio sp. INlla14]